MHFMNRETCTLFEIQYQVCNNIFNLQITPNAHTDSQSFIIT